MFRSKYTKENSKTNIYKYGKIGKMEKTKKFNCFNI